MNSAEDHPYVLLIGSRHPSHMTVCERQQAPRVVTVANQLCHDEVQAWEENPRPNRGSERLHGDHLRSWATRSGADHWEITDLKPVVPSHILHLVSLAQNGHLRAPAVTRGNVRRFHAARGRSPTSSNARCAGSGRRCWTAKTPAARSRRYYVDTGRTQPGPLSSVDSTRQRP